AHDHLRVAAGGKPREGSKLSARSPEQIIELCRQFPKMRLQQQILSHLTAAFVSLRGHLSDELREVNFCRVRLTELLRLLEERPPDEAQLGSVSKEVGRAPGESENGLRRVLFVSGCRDFADATEMTLEGFDEERMLELDAEMEQMLRGQFTALVHVCMAKQ